MSEVIDRILISREQIARRVGELAGEITLAYSNLDRGLTLVTVLSGSIIFLADLIRALPMKLRIGLVTVSSYRGRATTGRPPTLLKDLDVEVAGEDVLLIDDILDTGRTLKFVLERLRERKPASVKTCVLLRKPDRAPQDLPVDFVGFDIEDEFVVGYGLDYNGHYRNHPDICVLRADVNAT